MSTIVNVTETICSFCFPYSENKRVFLFHGIYLIMYACHNVSALGIICQQKDIKRPFEREFVSWSSRSSAGDAEQVSFMIC